jgi:cellulose synthase/poly-beta-1,6-N-acetylglucosamine synthase-like glycosyltransferase
MNAHLFWMIILFFAIALVTYAYALYPLFLKCISFGRRYVRTTSYNPKISIVVPAYNEEKIIRQKIENCLALDYPKELLQVMVCSDASSDRTAAMAAEYAGRGVTVIDYRERTGKTGVLNKSIPLAKGEIVILTDANTMFKSDAIKSLVSLYTSEKVGAVLGRVDLFNPENARELKNEIRYRDFEATLKHHEGLFGAALGAFGGLYSIRKSLYVPLPPNAYSNDDFLTPLRIIQRGYKVLFDRQAISTEETGQTVAEEFGRRIRIGAGNFQSFFLLLPMLNPLLGMPFVLYVSHKVLRWFSPFLLLLIFAANLPLVHLLPFALLFCAQCAFYGLAILGAIFAKIHVKVPGVSGIYHFVSMNAALLLGFFRYLRGIRSAVWQSTERASA